MRAVRVKQTNQLLNVEGLLRFEVGALHLEYQWIYCAGWKGSVKQLSIPLTDIIAIDLVRTWWGGKKLVLQARTMDSVQKVPGMTQGRVEWIVVRGDYQAAQTLVDGLRKPEIDHRTSLDI